METEHMNESGSADIDALVASAPEPHALLAAIEREAAAAYIEAFAANYPEDVFPSIDFVVGTVSRDRVAASMARHLCKVLAADIRRGLHVGEEGE
jgi:hypothetical protein